MSFERQEPHLLSHLRKQKGELFSLKIKETFFFFGEIAGFLGYNGKYL
jgi:hypothetical protein